MVVIFLSFAIILLFFAGVGVKILVRKNGQFKRHCSSRDPYTGMSDSCQCAKAVKCNEIIKHKYQPLDINDELMKEVKGSQ